MNNFYNAKSFNNQSTLNVDNISTNVINNIVYTANINDVSNNINILYSTVGNQNRFLNSLSGSIFNFNSTIGNTNNYLNSLSGSIININSTLVNTTNYLNSLSGAIKTINSGTFGTITATGLITNSIISSGTNGPLVIDPNYSTNNHVLIYDKLVVNGNIENYGYSVSCNNCFASSWLGCTALNMNSGNINNCGGIYYSSDDRLKNNESVINGTSILLQLRPEIYDKYSNFDLSGSFIRESGLVVQEVYNIQELRHLIHLPSDVSGNLITTQSENVNDDPNYQNWGSTPASLNYMGLIPYLIRGFQEQQTLIESLKNRIIALENP